MSAYDRSFPSLYRGIVEINEDPENLGRCKIRVPAVHGALTYPADILPWARPIALSPISKDRGSVMIPDVGDIVWVMFEGSEKDFPIYLGGTYSKGDVAIDKNRVDFYIEGDDKISYDRESKSYSIRVGSNELIVTHDNIIIKGDVLVEGDIKATGDISTGSVRSLNAHYHQAGLTTTSAPI